VSTADRYRRFADTEARGGSPCYEEWALGVAADRELLALVDELPVAKRQPNLLFAAARYNGIPAGSFRDFRRALLADWPAARAVMLARRTQTNEPGRCAVLLPILAALPQPLALLEVGASAGLCLYPDRYSYRYGHHPRLDPPDGPARVVLDCEITGPVPIPTALPRVVWRAGIGHDVRWLTALIWPEHDNRRARLAPAIDVARADPAHIVTGDLNEQLTTLAAAAPREATLVIFHSAVLAYLDAESRTTFVHTVRGLNARWIANEGPDALPVTAPPSPEPDRALFLLALDGEPIAHSAGHGQSLHWL
jgi:hypothetical protein